MCYESVLSSTTKGQIVAEYDDLINIGELLAPIAGEHPHGRDTRTEFGSNSPYQRLTAARSAARDAEKRALMPGTDDPGPPPNWGAVAAAAADLLAGHAKDIEAAATLTEALLRTDGLRGLAAGATIITGLVDQYWGALFPGVDEDEPDETPAEACLRPLANLAAGSRATLPPALRLVPLFTRADGTPVTLADYDAAVAIERLDEEQRERRISGGAVTLEALDELARGAPTGLAQLAAGSAAALAAWEAMEQTLLSHADRHAPPLGEAKAVLARIAAFAQRLAPAVSAEAPAASETPASAPAGSAPGTTAAPTAAAGGPPGAIASREDALRRLDQVADWFRRSEPHSPLSYTLTEAVRRGRMSLPDLLAEVVADYSTRAAILTALGIKPPPDE